MKKIRQIIREELGFISDIKDISISILNNIEKKIDKKEIKENFPYRTSFILTKNNFTIKDIKINELDIYFYFKFNDDVKNNHLNGSYIEKSLQQTTSEQKTKYNFNIEIVVYNWDFEFDIMKKIPLIISHEIHHAYTAIKKLHKSSKSNKLNSTYKQFRAFSKGLTDKYWQFKEFCDVFYLNLPEERNARIHELYQEAQNLKGRPKDEIVESMSKYSAFKDFRRMRDLLGVDFSNIPMEDKKQFVKNFFTSLIYQKMFFNKNLRKVKYENNPDKFFDYWKKEIYKNTEVLFKKTNKIINFLNHEQINENEELMDLTLNWDSLNYIFGIDSLN